MTSERKNWDNYFLDIAVNISSRTTCMRQSVGAVIVMNKRILSTGYNGAPSGIKHCNEVGCIRKKMNVPSGERAELCMGIHGEQNAILQAAYYGVSIKDSILYCTHSPCLICAKMIINAGITKIIYLKYYNDKLSFKMLNEAGIKTTHYIR